MLINYLPNFLKTIEDYKQLLGSLDIEIKYLNDGIGYIINQASILNADERRIEEWERFLRITKQGNLYQRKKYIIATLTTVGKLNKTKIEEIVNIYTNGGGAIVEFTNSTIIVKVKPPKDNENYLFPDIERTLSVMKPAHLGLSVVRFYSSWQLIKDDFPTWGHVNKYFKNWNFVRQYVGGYVPEPPIPEETYGAICGTFLVGEKLVGISNVPKRAIVGEFLCGTMNVEGD